MNTIGLVKIEFFLTNQRYEKKSKFIAQQITLCLVVIKII